MIKTYAKIFLGFFALWNHSEWIKLSQDGAFDWPHCLNFGFDGLIGNEKWKQ